MDSTSRINITKSFSVKHENTMRKCNSKDSKQSVTLNKIFSLPFLSKSYIITHITFTAFQLLYLYITNQETTIDIILCCITLSILLFILLIYIFTPIRNWKHTSSLIGICFYCSYYYQFYFITPNTAEHTHKFYFILIITNITLGFSLGEHNYYILAIHWIVIFFGNISVLIYLSVCYKKFAMESICTLHLYIVFFIISNLFVYLGRKKNKRGLNGIFPYVKTNTIKSNTNVNNDENATMKIKEFCSMLNMGYILCVGDKFEILEYNDIIDDNFLFLVSYRNRNGDVMKKNNYTTSFTKDFRDFKMLSLRGGTLLQRQKSCFTNIFDEMNENEFMTKYFDVHFFSQKSEAYKNNNVITDETFCSKQKLTLIELIMKHRKTNFHQSDKNIMNFINMGLFKFSKRNISIYFNIFMKHIPSNKSSKETYEFILNEIPSQKANKVILSNYENTLKKIAHEIKTPSMNIQKITELLLTENEVNKSFSTIYKPNKYNEMILVHSEQLLTIKFLSEICLLTVRDIVEHASLLNFDQFRDDDYELSNANTKEGEHLKTFPNKKSSFLSLHKFVLYVKQLARTYLFMLNKKVEIEFIIPKTIDDTQIIIDEQKLNQVISNLLTNAIKSTPENKRIVFTMSLLESNNYRNPLFNQTDCFESYFKMNFMEREYPLVSARMQKKKENVLILGVRITLEDNGTGIDMKNMREINDKHVHEVNEIHDYSEAKGIGSGIKISKKLCDEMGVEIKCELISREGIIMKVKPPGIEISGTKITLDILGEIFPISVTKEDVINNTESEKTRIESEHIINISKNDKDLLYKSKNIEHNNTKKQNDDSQFMRSNTKLSKVSNTLKGLLGKLESSNNISFQRFQSHGKDLDSTHVALKDSNSNVSAVVSEFSISKNTNARRFKRLRKKQSTYYVKPRRLRQYQTETKTLKRLSNNNLKYNSQNHFSPRSPKHSGTAGYKRYKHKFSLRQCYEKSTVMHGYEDSYTSKLQPYQQNEYDSNVSDNRIAVGIIHDTLGDNNCTTVNGSDYQDLEILIVDDDSNITDSIKRIIKNLGAKNNYGFKIKLFCDGMELLYDLYSGLKQNINTNKVILCDEMMKYINGSEAYAMIVKYFDVLLKSILFISISAFSDGAHKKKLGQMGVEHIYEKPITKGNIEYIFNNIVKKKFPIQNQASNG